MLTSGKVLFLVTIFVVAVMVLSVPAPKPDIFDGGFNDIVKGTVKKLSKYCGDKLCAESSPFHYYECCGGVLDTRCCLKLQDWVVPAAIGVGVFLLGICVASCFQCR